MLYFKKYAKSVYKILRLFYSSSRPIGYTKTFYKRFYKRKLNLKNPVYISEKIQYLKLYNYPKNDKVVLAADKYGLHQYLTDKNLEDYIVPMIDIYTKAEEIDINDLPQSFVLKKTNASGFNLIVKDKKDITNKEMRKIVNNWLKKDFGKISVEKHYSNATSRIICEPFLNIGDEYRIFMVSGEIGYIQIIQWVWSESQDGISQTSDSIVEGHRKHFRIHLDSEWNLIWKDKDIGNSFVKKPTYWDELVHISHQIAKDFPVVRIDFNEVDGTPKITELTFTPASGFLEVLKQNPELDYNLGKLLYL